MRAKLENLDKPVKPVKKSFWSRKILGLPVYLIILIISICAIAAVVYQLQVNISYNKPVVEVTGPESVTVYQGEWAFVNATITNPANASYKVRLDYSISDTIPENCSLVVQYYNGSAWETIDNSSGSFDIIWLKQDPKTYRIRMTLIGEPLENGINVKVQFIANILEVGMP